MAESLITVDVSDVIDYSKKDLKRLRGAMAGARRAFINNMAFNTRNVALFWGIPRVMTVRNPAFLRRTLTVEKATRAKEVATLGQSGVGHTFTSLREEEFGGSMHRQPATIKARGRTAKARIQKKARLSQEFISPEDIAVAHEKDEEHRVHVFLERLKRPGGIEGDSYYKKPFVLYGQGFRPGLMIQGKAQYRSGDRPRQPSRTIYTLRKFTKKTTRVRRRRWLWPSIKQVLRNRGLRLEWARAVKHAQRFMR